MIIAAMRKPEEGMSYTHKAAKAPRTTSAKRAACVVSFGAGFLVVLGLIFFQAGVVAPPEALIFESLAIFGDSV